MCRRWKITELALFGSALREDFGPSSDVDFLVTFAADAEWTLLDRVRMEEGLKRSSAATLISSAGAQWSGGA